MTPEQLISCSIHRMSGLDRIGTDAAQTNRRPTTQKSDVLELKSGGTGFAGSGGQVNCWLFLVCC
jgi:hypothetical protein